MLLRLDSLSYHGFGPRSSAISLIYSHLLNTYDAGLKEDVLINVIETGDHQLVLHANNKLRLHFQYDLPSNFKALGPATANTVFTAVIHEALLFLAQQKPEINVAKLEVIRKEIVSKHFGIELPCESYPNEKNSQLIAYLSVAPNITRYSYYLTVKDGEAVRCRVLIYEGVTTITYVPDLFTPAEWVNEDHLRIAGKLSETEVHIFVNEGKVELVPSANKSFSPLFEIHKATDQY